MPTEKQDRERAATYWMGEDWSRSPVVARWVENGGPADMNMRSVAETADLIATVREAAYREGLEAAAKVAKDRASECRRFHAENPQVDAATRYEWLYEANAMDWVRDAIRALIPPASGEATVGCFICRRPATHLDVDGGDQDGSRETFPCCGQQPCCDGNEPGWSTAPLAKGGT